MRERFNFVGSGLTPKEETTAALSLANAQRRENTFHTSELRKTTEEESAIALADYLLKRNFAYLDIPEIPELRVDRFHVMSDEWFEKNKGKGTKGSFHAFKDKVVLSRGRAETPVQLYKTIFHEAVHSVSRIVHRVDTEKKAIDEYRVGYSITNTFRDDDVHTHFAAFNEGVVEMIVEEMFHENGSKIQQTLSVSDRDFEGVKFAYVPFRLVVKAICRGLADVSGAHPIDIWKKIERGQFTGEMMHLRDIEYAYGKGALRILDALQLDPDAIIEEKDEVTKTKNEQIFQFFESYTLAESERETVRSQLARNILGEEDFEKYCV